MPKELKMDPQILFIDQILHQSCLSNWFVHMKYFQH